MNYNLISKEIMAGKRIYDLPLKVCYYARVSTDSDVQLNSLQNQLDYYKNYITSNDNWTYVDGYIDEGISGVRVEKREAFKKMINDAIAKKFDLIITKEVSRFARDLEDSIHYIRKLKENGVGVYFENQNLNTFDDSSELILNIMFNLAQDESRKLSSRVKFGHKQAIKKGHVLGSSNITGYKKNNCKLEIVPEEAKMIKIIYELYITGEYGFYKLSKKLGSMGYFNKKGNYYDKDSLKRIIENPKYKGFYRGNIYETIDYRTKKRSKILKSKQIIYKANKNIIPPIVSEEVWNKANQILESRTKNYKNSNYFFGSLKYPFSSKIFCKEHNCHFQRSHGSRAKNRPTYSCSKYLQYRKDACNSPIIAEKDLLNILKSIMDDLLTDKDVIVKDLIDLYKQEYGNKNYKEEINNINKSIETLENKKALAFDLVLNKDIDKDYLIVQLNKFEHEIKKYLVKKEEVIKQKKLFENKNYTNIINNIIKELNGECLDEFIRKFVDEIIVSKIDEDRYNIKLDIYLNLSGEENNKKIGANHINGSLEHDALYIENKKCDTIENKRKNTNRNKFTYSVYIVK